MTLLQKKGKMATCKRKRGGPEAAGNPTVPFEEPESLPTSTPAAHHHISSDVRHKINLSEWLGNHEDDPALRVSISIVMVLHNSYIFSRTFCHSSKTTSSDESSNSNTMAMRPSSHLPNEILLILSITESSDIKSFA
jgi:hypothetical protein